MRKQVLPWGVHRPWAGSNRYKISELFPFTVEGPPPIRSSSLPFCVRFKIRLQLMMPTTHPATLDTGRVANTYPGGISPRSLIRPCQSARTPFGYAMAIGSVKRDTNTVAPFIAIVLDRRWSGQQSTAQSSSQSRRRRIETRRNGERGDQAPHASALSASPRFV